MITDKKGAEWEIQESVLLVRFDDDDEEEEEKEEEGFKIYILICFHLVLWHIHHCGSFNANSIYIYI